MYEMMVTNCGTYVYVCIRTFVYTACGTVHSLIIKCMYVKSNNSSFFSGKGEGLKPTVSSKQSVPETHFPMRIDMKDVWQSVGNFITAPFKHALNMAVCMYVLYVTRPKW
jgi:hypothetical protein